MIQRDPGTLFCILIDDIEDWSQCGEQVSERNTAQSPVLLLKVLLTVVDQLRQYPNFVLLGTSNSGNLSGPDEIEPIGFIQHVPSPSAESYGEILRRCFLEMPAGYLSPDKQFPAPCARDKEIFTKRGQSIAYKDFIYRGVPGPHFTKDGKQASSFTHLRALVRAQLPSSCVAILPSKQSSRHPAVRI